MPSLGGGAVELGQPPPQAQDSIVDIMLQHHWIVKGNLRYKRILYLLRQRIRFHKPQEGAARLVITLLSLEPPLVLLWSFWVGMKKLSSGAKCS